MKFFKLKYGEQKEKVVRLSSIEFLNMVASKTPIWQQSFGNNRRKSIANEAKRECWRQIARKLVGRSYTEAKVKDRLEIEQGLKSRFHAMRDQWVKCRNRKKLYAFEDQIKFLDTKQQLSNDEYKFEFDTETETNKIFIVSEEDVKSQDSDEYEEIEHTSLTAEDNVEMEEEHIQIEIANSAAATVYLEDGNIITEFPSSPSPAICSQSTIESSESTLLPASSFPQPPAQPPHSPASQPYCNKFDHSDTSMLYSCSCHCHKDELALKHRENDLFGKAIATLLNNMDGEKLFETKKAILSCIVRDMFIVDPSSATATSSSAEIKK